MDASNAVRKNRLPGSLCGGRFFGVILTLAFLTVKTAFSQPTVVDLWPEGRMPGMHTEMPEAEKPAEDAFHRITNVSQPTLSLFFTQKKEAPSPLVIVVPGGGYKHVVVDKEGSEIAEWLNSIGVSAAVLKYRVPDNREGAFQDLQRALRLVRVQAKEWNVDPKRVGVIGFSAGGHLAAKASTLLDALSYPKIDDVDQQSARPDFVILVYPAYLEQDGKISQELNLKAQIPPTLIIQNEGDKKYVSGSKLYAAALEQEKSPHRFLLYQSGGHGHGLHGDKDVRVWPQAADEWLREIGVQKVRENNAANASEL